MEDSGRVKSYNATSVRPNTEFGGLTELVEEVPTVFDRDLAIPVTQIPLKSLCESVLITWPSEARFLLTWHSQHRETLVMFEASYVPRVLSTTGASSNRNG